jgi:hypothetical protein
MSISFLFKGLKNEKLISEIFRKWLKFSARNFFGETKLGPLRKKHFKAVKMKPSTFSCSPRWLNKNIEKMTKKVSK